MLARNASKRYPTVLLTVLALIACTFPFFHGKLFPTFGNDISPHDTNVATVYGKPISITKIAVASDSPILRLRFEQIHGRMPIMKDDEKEIERLRAVAERDNFRYAVQRAIRERVVSGLHLDVTNAEVNSCIDDLNREYDKRNKAGFVGPKDGIRTLLEAYEDVLEHGADPNEVYQTRLSKYMTADEWQMRLKYEGTPERRKALESLLSLNDEKLVDLESTCRQIIETKKLRICLPF